MRRTVDHDLARRLIAIGYLHTRRIVRQTLFGGTEPAQRLVAFAKLGPKINFGMAIAVIARHRGRIAAIELADGAIGNTEDRGMHEGGVISVAFVLQDEFPVGLDAMFEKTRGDLDLAFWRGANEAIDSLGRAPEVFLQRRAFGRERTEHEAAIGLHACDAAKPQL